MKNFFPKFILSAIISLSVFSFDVFAVNGTTCQTQTQDSADDQSGSNAILVCTIEDMEVSSSNPVDVYVYDISGTLRAFSTTYQNQITMSIGVPAAVYLLVVINGEKSNSVFIPLYPGIVTNVNIAL